MEDQMADREPVANKSRSDKEKIKGVFSNQQVVKFGTGTTTRKTIRKTYWFANEQAHDTIEVQPLNKNFVPSGPKRSIPKEDFLMKFAPEPEFYVSTVYPKMREMEESIQKGEQHREEGETYSAAFEFDSALNVDEQNVRANFGLGLTYLDRGETNKANDIFQRLVSLEAAFQQEHKHLFNDFGISLRKNKMFDQALEYYKRALELTTEDENLHMNVARAYYEMGELPNTVESLKRALELNPNLKEARQFWEFLEGKGHKLDPLPEPTGPLVSGLADAVPSEEPEERIPDQVHLEEEDADQEAAAAQPEATPAESDADTSKDDDSFGKNRKQKSSGGDYDFNF
jgi:tetratricopeptide (TPR) repeat protein